MCICMLSSVSRCTPRSRTVVTGCMTSAPLFNVISDCDRLFNAADEPNHMSSVFAALSCSRLEPHQSAIVNAVVGIICISSDVINVTIHQHTSFKPSIHLRRSLGSSESAILALMHACALMSPFLSSFMIMLSNPNVFRPLLGNSLVTFRCL